MSQPQNQSNTGARNSGRRRNRNSNRRPSSQGGSHSGSHSHGSSKAPAPKKSLAQKVLGFFGIGKAAKPAARPPRPVNPGAPQAQGKVTRESMPNRGPREGRENREGGQRSQARKPENVEVTNPRLYIGNLSYDATENDLQEVFNGVGRVNSVEIVTNSRTQRSKGYGFVELGSIEEAKRAVETLHDKEFMGRKLVVSGAKPKDESRGEE